MTKAEQFCKLNGIEYSYSLELVKACNGGSPSFVSKSNPTFADAKSILEVMMIKRKDFEYFIAQLLEEHGASRLPTLIWFIEKYILNPDKLLDEAIKFCEESHE